MEKMPYQPELERAATMAAQTTVTTSDWRSGLPVLATPEFTLRELRSEDAPSLLAMLTTDEVARFISPPPTTLEGFEKFIACSHRERLAGNYISFGVVPAGLDHAAGIFQLRSIEPGFGSSEWGFALGLPFWGTGLFVEGARLVLNFAVGIVLACSGSKRARRLPMAAATALFVRLVRCRRCAAAIVPPQRAVSRPGVVVRAGRGLAHAAHR